MMRALRFSKLVTFLTLVGSTTSQVQAQSYPLPPVDTDLIGEVFELPSRQEDTLLDIARRYSLGHDEIVIANPDTDRWLPGEGRTVILPSRYVLPDAERRGIVLNIPEMRLYYFPKNTKQDVPSVYTYPVSIGRMDWATPLGQTRIIQKVKDPAWHPPASIKAEAAARGETVPDVVPAGPNNPLGQHALRLGVPGYLIHGTNRPYGVGMRVTHGCVRMYPEDIEQLFRWVDVNTPVQLVNQPVKAGWAAEQLFIEVHPPLEESDSPDRSLYDHAVTVVLKATAGRPTTVSWGRVRQAVEDRSGIPIVISVTAPSVDSSSRASIF